MAGGSGRELGQGSLSQPIEALRRRAHDLIPGGAHTYSKGDDQFPENAPAFIFRGSGCRVWDPEGREFIDWGMGISSVTLGHAYEPVLQAVREQLLLGANFTRPSLLEGELAEMVVDLIPSADMVKFCKNGSDATSAAIRLARAFTGRSRVAFCQDHPFYSFYDWFIGTTPVNAGVPEEVAALSMPFRYNDLESLRRLFEQYPRDIACVILEPVALETPAPSFLAQVQEMAHAHGALLIFDETVSGFRWDLRGAQHYFSVTPDLSTFGKAMANGFSVSMVVGRRDIMELGGIRDKRARVFLLSCTHGGETHCLAAARATLNELRDKNVIPHLWRIGGLLQQGIQQRISQLGLDDFVGCIGYACRPGLAFRDETGATSWALRTLFLQETIARGVLMPFICVSLSHDEAVVEQTLQVVGEALEVCAQAVRGNVQSFVRGSLVKPVFRKYV